MAIGLSVIKFIILLIVSFFACQIISNNKKRVSYIGTILICFSTAVVQYINSGLIEALIFGELAFICFNNILKHAKLVYLWIIGLWFRNYRFLIVK